ncbi:MAG: hypothetical protein KF832_05050 [Caldilineaceae bacterium]|nr:hypothetical protein [Caldilineaceae bacterium]
MFEPTSRYYGLATATYTGPDGVPITYVRRRFLPRGEMQALLAEVTVTDGDRLDLIAAHTIGDPEQFWRIADANNAMQPFDLVAEPGAVLRVTTPQVLP